MAFTLMALSYTSKPCCSTGVDRFVLFMPSTSSLPFLLCSGLHAAVLVSFPPGPGEESRQAQAHEDTGLKCFPSCGVCVSYRGEDILNQRNDSLVVEFQSSASRCRRYYFGHGAVSEARSHPECPLPAPCYMRSLRTSHQSCVFGWLDLAESSKHVCGRLCA